MLTLNGINMAERCGGNILILKQGKNRVRLKLEATDIAYLGEHLQRMLKYRRVELERAHRGLETREG